jgi:hypothetical protein
MRRLGLGLMAITLVLGVTAFAGNETKDAKTEAKAAPKSLTVQGELVDMGCYLAEGAKGESHKSCASMCIASGMPMGLLTKDGKLYLLTLNHDNADPYNSAKKLAAEQVNITGPVSERNGVMSLQVDNVNQVSMDKAEQH